MPALVPTLTKDRREDIFVYLMALLATASVNSVVIKGVHRDRNGLDGKDGLPAIFLLDGKETLVTEMGGRSIVGMPPAIYRLEPQIFVQLVPRDDDTNATVSGASAPVGPELSAWRVALIKLINSDINLPAMVGPNGAVRFVGSETDMQASAPLVGQLRVDFQFQYAVDPSKL